MNPSPRALPRIEMVVACLIVFTVILLAWQYFGMERVLEFSNASGRDVIVYDDRVQQGHTVATLTRKPGALVMDCDIHPDVEWPYCILMFPLTQDSKGMDLSEFETITVDMSTYGPDRHVRFNIRNFEPGLSIPNEHMSQKVIETSFKAPEKGILTIPVKVLRTAPWWLESRKVPLLQSDVRIDNVTSIDFSIGSRDKPGMHRMELRSLKFHGKWISQNQLLLILIAVWVSVAMAWLAFALFHYRTQLGRSTTRLALLSRINRALELEANELAGQVYNDSLTGALNREGLRDTLLNKWQQPGIADNPIAVVFVDLDHFKQVNDTHGHSVGDDVLRSFAAAVQKEIRASDKLVRWGGEEFLIVCPCTGADEAQGLADKLRRSVHDHVWPCGLRLTASFGVTSLHTGEDFGDAIKRADGALYQAKSNGRNCVQLA
jgi:diguanylate cyclase (GGDEF)-like protein